MRQRALFFDRDGTLIDDVGYIRDPARVRLLAGAADALREVRQAGFLLVVVSNQSGIARGLVSSAEATAVHERVVAELARAAVELDDARYCPHAPDAGCACRKPAPGLLVDAARELGVDLAASVMVGDKGSDVEAGRRAGCRSIRFAPDGAGDDDGVAVARSWDEIADLVLRVPA
jgi:D-glycero-D-manno-heptose 1,7-bisphosphate phosphatase